MSLGEREREGGKKGERERERERKREREREKERERERKRGLACCFLNNSLSFLVLPSANLVRSRTLPEREADVCVFFKRISLSSSTDTSLKHEPLVNPVCIEEKYRMFCVIW